MSTTAPGVIEIPVDAREAACIRWSNIQIPNGYQLTEDGVYLNETTGKGESAPKLLSGPIWVTARTRDYRNKEWGLVVHWFDIDGMEHERAIPARRLHEPRSSLPQELAGEGLHIVPGRERLLITYLGSYSPEIRISSVSRIGWMDGQVELPAYVLPTKVVALGGATTVLFQPERHSPSSLSLHDKGSLEQWRRFVATPCRGNPLLIFSLCAAFAGPLLKWAGLDSCGFHLYGNSSKGKTTALQVAASVWGCGADPATSDLTHIRRWHTTANALEGLAAGHNDGLLVLDEMGSVDSADFGRVIYDLAGGQGKARMNKDAELREARFWRIVFLSSGEISVREKIEEGRRPARAGQLNRFLDIPILDQVVMETNNKTPEVFVNELKRACARFYGTAGIAFLDRLIGCQPDIQSLQHAIRDALDRWTQQLTDGLDLDTPQRRSIQRLAVVALGGSLAVEFKVLPFTVLDVQHAVQRARDAWLGDDGNLSEAQRGAIALREFLLAQRARFLDALADHSNNGGNVRDVAGYYNAQQGVFLLTDSALREACRGFSTREVLSELARLRMLYLNNGEGRFKSRHTIQGIGRIQLFGVRRELLEHHPEDGKSSGFQK
ncbi:DUF927 domain-containing protein [Thioalbus denitrificans]|uniref:Uncharacterized protein (DUF927 family) n=1 Tax=Thioalbus denitrificans TaxID=547122 RepID=A0A369CCI1_9GAMM|nr:DUF927 domain-containing protein [Thioalbus denitrificans]RCX31710.1 uncharacterized protein (DUF927 family) [Thioalbus denitrificans]